MSSDAISRLHRWLPALLLFLAPLALFACDTDEPDAPPPGLSEARANPGTFSFVEVDGMTCRDGSSTGIGLRLQERAASDTTADAASDGLSDDLVIYLEGGGACFNPVTCGQNRARFTEDDFFSEAFAGGYSGIFDATQPANPVAGWNIAYVSYCTGDVHSGSNPDGRVPGVDSGGDGTPDRQRFVGYDNVGRVLDFLEDYVSGDFDRVLLTGASAGGFGTLSNYRQVTGAFPDAEVTLLNDSGPILPNDDILSPALQERWRQLWNLGETLPDDDRLAGADGFENIYAYYADTYPGASLGLISFERDATIRFFYSFGQLDDPECAARLSQEERVPCISGAAYEDALYGLRAQLSAPWATFYSEVPDPRLHTFLRAPYFYQSTAGGQPLAAWVEDLLEGEAQDRGTQQDEEGDDSSASNRSGASNAR